MRTLLAWLICLGVLFSGGTASVAHAMEPAIGTPIMAQAIGHFAGDADEVPADADKDYPHHHASCHDHQVGLPAIAAPGPSRALQLATSIAFRPIALREGPVTAQPRPPRA